jgi:hypothetical protein
MSTALGRADAQSNDSGAIAEQLFKQARELAQANNWVEACPKFEASLRYDPVLGTRLNLATCYEHVGKLASAWNLYRESIELARKAGDVKRRDYAQRQATALEPRLPRLAISAPGKPPAGLLVKRDGTTIDAGALGVALYVDAGPHEIAASAPGFATFTRTVTLLESTTVTVAIPELTALAATGRPQPPSKDHEPSIASSPTGDRVTRSESLQTPSRTRTYVAIGLGGAGVVATGFGLVFGVKARSDYSDARTLCGASLVCDAADYDKGKQLIRDSRSQATTATILVAAGVAAIAAGAIVFLTAPHTRERATARIVPVAHDRGAGLAIIGGF